MATFGNTYDPTGQQDQRTKPIAGTPIQQALQVLSLRLPRILGQNAVAPRQLLQAGGQFRPQGASAALMPPTAMPPAGMVPSGMGASAGAGTANLPAWMRSDRPMFGGAAPPPPGISTSQTPGGPNRWPLPIPHPAPAPGPTQPVPTGPTPAELEYQRRMQAYAQQQQRQQGQAGMPPMRRY